MDNQGPNTPRPRTPPDPVEPVVPETPPLPDPRDPDPYPRYEDVPPARPMDSADGRDYSARRPLRRAKDEHAHRNRT